MNLNMFYLVIGSAQENEGLPRKFDDKAKCKTTEKQIQGTVQLKLGQNTFYIKIKWTLKV